MTRIVAVLVAVMAANATAGPCLVHGLDPEIVTPAGTTIDQFGGVVIIATESLRKDAPHADVAVQPYAFRSGKLGEKANVSLLAPGLAIYAPPPALQGGKALDLEDAKDHSAVRVSFAHRAVRDLPTDPAPVPTAIVHTTKVPMFRTESTFVTLKTAPPATDVALLVRESSSTAPLARSWVLVRGVKQTTIEIYVRDRCRPEIPGTVPTRAGDSVTLAWVDVAGRVSLWSAPMVVTKQ